MAIGYSKIAQGHNCYPELNFQAIEFSGQYPTWIRRGRRTKQVRIVISYDISPAACWNIPLFQSDELAVAVSVRKFHHKMQKLYF